MRSIAPGLPQAFLFAVSIVAQRPTDVCPLLGPAFPAPRYISTAGAFKAATSSINAALDAAVTSGSTPYGDGPYNKTSFSVTFFSSVEDRLIYEYHHTSPSTARSKIGTTKVDADSIYRIASVSKLVSAYLLLIHDGETHLNTPVAKIIPELARSNLNSSDGVLIDWEQVTVADLMTHMSGLGYNYGYDDRPPEWLNSPAFPRIPADQMAPCNYVTDNGTYVGCTREQLIEAVLSTPALFPGGYTPIYSNEGFDLFGLALENIAGTTLSTVLAENLIKPLGLNGTSYHTPNTTKNGVVVPLDGSISQSEWYQEFRYGNADGGYFSSSNDMAAIGRAILSSSQISPAITNRWLKPRTFTSSTGSAQAVGGPWEIFKTTASSQEYDYYLYTKEGDLETYHTLFVLIPDFDFGFTVFSAGAFAAPVPISNLVVDTVAPVLEALAAEQAETRFAGTYTSSAPNSSVTIETDSHPGLKVTSWTSNATDVLDILADGWPRSGFDFRLYPNQLYAGDQVGFTGSMAMLPNERVPGVFSDPCQSWTGPGGTPYGKADLGSFVFEVDGTTGKARSVRPMALKVTLERE